MATTQDRRRRRRSALLRPRTGKDAAAAAARPAPPAGRQACSATGGPCVARRSRSASSSRGGADGGGQAGRLRRQAEVPTGRTSRPASFDAVDLPTATMARSAACRRRQRRRRDARLVGRLRLTSSTSRGTRRTSSSGEGVPGPLPHAAQRGEPSRRGRDVLAPPGAVQDAQVAAQRVTGPGRAMLPAPGRAHARPHRAHTNLGTLERQGR